ncbi:MAG: hypothetical protein P4M07_22175 [Xanthobacteraceae bacterium]|nr:hypothetical protein [Xanthobacteraceae bacterium]
MSTPAIAKSDHTIGVGRPVIGLRDLFDLSIVVLAASLLAWVMFVCDAERPEMGGANLLLGINGALAIAGLVVAMRCRHPILMTSFYFDFIFLAIAPIQQIGVKFDPIFSYENDFNAALVCCLTFTVTGLIALLVCGRPVRSTGRLPSFLARSIYRAPYYPLVLWTAIAIAVGVVLAFFGPLLLTSRYELSQFVISTLDKSGSLLLTSFLSPLILIGSVIGLRSALIKRERLWIMAFFVLATLAGVITLNPAVLPRFRISALLVFALLALTRWNNTRLLALFLAAGIAVSPLLNAFRTATSFGAEVRPFERFFAHLDFDCFSLIVHVIHYVGNEGFSYGTNILSALLFFIPRAIWPGKSEHVGYYIFPQLRYYRDVWTDNVSSPPPAEGYFACGMIGAAVFGALVWAGFVVLERAARSAERDSPLQLMACLTPMYAIMILRGPFLVGYSELLGNYAALATALALLHFKLQLAPPHPGSART